jgi:hypothetical protein
MGVEEHYFCVEKGEYSHGRPSKSSQMLIKFHLFAGAEAGIDYYIIDVGGARSQVNISSDPLNGPIVELTNWSILARFVGTIL